MHYKTILAVTDLSVIGNQAAQRASLLAANCGAELYLMYVPAPENSPCLDHDIHLSELARIVSNGAGVPVKVIPQRGAHIEDVAAQANCADLLVSSYRVKRELASVFHGAWHQRVMRLTRCPVLLTRSDARLPYAKIVVAVDFSELDRPLVQLACEVDDRAEIELFHAVSRADEAKLRSADVSWEVVRAFRVQQEAHAQKRLRTLAQSIDASGRTLSILTGSGDAGYQTSWHQHASRAALVVVGKRRRSAVMELLCGAVSSNVLAYSSADVLIVPRDHRASSRAAAKSRIAAEQTDRRGAFLAGRKMVR